MVREYLKLSAVKNEIGPHTSQWIKANETEGILLCIENSKCFCLAKGHTGQ